MIGIVDYGVGNLFSLRCSFEAIGQECTVSSDAQTLAACDKLILPGVGAFGDAADKLRETGLDRLVIDQANKGKPLMGVCLGMQLLFENSEEFGLHQGLGLLKGRVVGMQGRLKPEYKIPQIGWNGLHFPKNKPVHPLFAQLREGDCVYFVHSFFAVDCEDSLIASTEYDLEITAAAAKGNVCGCQFHPEKSGEVGLNILRAFCRMEGGTL